MEHIKTASLENFPADRECLIPRLPETLAICWQRSRQTLQQIRNIVSESLPAEVETIYVCGSMGRMEQLPASDCDLVIVTKDDVDPGSSRGQQIHADLWSQLESLGLIRPKPHGIFSATVTCSQLIDPSSRGRVDEDQFVYGKRIQLLLDSQPIAHQNRFRQLQSDVLSRFQRTEDAREEQWLALLNDVIRYWKSLSTRTIWLDDVSRGDWRYLNVKFRHSRNLLIFGLLLLLGEASRRHHSSRDWLRDRLSLTPLERVNLVSEFTACVPLLEQYAEFLNQMSNRDLVAALKSEEPICNETPEYEGLMKNGAEFVNSLTEILHSCAENWPTAVRRELLLAP